MRCWTRLLFYRLWEAVSGILPTHLHSHLLSAHPLCSLSTGLWPPWSCFFSGLIKSLPIARLLLLQFPSPDPFSWLPSQHPSLSFSTVLLAFPELPLESSQPAFPCGSTSPSPHLPAPGFILSMCRWWESPSLQCQFLKAGPRLP